MGSMANDAIFDPAMLTGIVVQVKYKSKGDSASGQKIRPFGIFRDLEAPLPYVAFLMELGTESAYGHQGKKVESTVWSRDRNTKFSTLVQEWSVEVDNLAKAKDKTESERKKIKRQMEAKRQDMDSYNRYSISARGIHDVYGILAKANITDAFATLLKVTLPSPPENAEILKHMRPLERMETAIGHTAWMWDFMTEKPNEVAGRYE